MLLSPIGRAADIDQVNVERLKHGIWFGPTLQTLSASSNSNEASVAYRLDALAGVSGGADFWPSEEMGLNLRLTVGAPGKSMAYSGKVLSLPAIREKVHLFIAYLITQDLGRVRG